jgi:hypothetical protein
MGPFWLVSHNDESVAPKAIDRTREKMTQISLKMSRIDRPPSFRDYIQTEKENWKRQITLFMWEQTVIVASFAFAKSNKVYTLKISAQKDFGMIRQIEKNKFHAAGANSHRRFFCLR